MLIKIYYGFAILFFALGNVLLLTSGIDVRYFTMLMYFLLSISFAFRATITNLSERIEQLENQMSMQEKTREP